MKIKKISNRKMGIINLVSLLSTFVWSLIYSIAVNNTHQSFHKLGESIYTEIAFLLITIFLLAISIINFFIARDYKKNQRKHLARIYIVNFLILFFTATQEIIFRLLIVLRDTIDHILNTNRTIIAFDTLALFIKIIAIIFYIVIFILNIAMIITNPDDKELNKEKILRKINKTGILFILITLFIVGTLIYSKTCLNLEDSELFASFINYFLL